MGSKDPSHYVSSDPVLAAHDALADARAAHRAALTGIAWRALGSLTGVGIPLGLMIWLCISASDAPSDDGIWAGVTFGWMGWLLLTWGVLWALWFSSGYRPSPRESRQRVHLARRRLRDVQANAVADTRLRAKAEDIAATRLAEKIVAEYRAPGADA
jgi:hypothetical protein